MKNARRNRYLELDGVSTTYAERRVGVTRRGLRIGTTQNQTCCHMLTYVSVAYRAGHKRRGARGGAAWAGARARARGEASRGAISSDRAGSGGRATGSTVRADRACSQRDCPAHNNTQLPDVGAICCPTYIPATSIVLGFSPRFIIVLQICRQPVRQYCGVLRTNGVPCW